MESLDSASSLRCKSSYRAPKFGFEHPYSSPRPNPGSPQYRDEPWHLSYAAIAHVLQEQWIARMTGATLDKLIARTAAAIRGGVDQARMEAILKGLNLPSFQSNVATP